MFQSCTSFVQAPELPATTLADYCYSGMFQDCTSLTQVQLPATTLAYGCYSYMFYGCTSLTQAPELPVTTLADYCYSNMFYKCTSLTQAPNLPATTLVDNCYYNMFMMCTKLNYVKCLATNTAASYCLNTWLYGVASTGTFECDNKKYFTLDSYSGIPTGWTITEINPDPPAPPEPEKPDLDVFDPNVPFCIENVGEAPVEIGLYNQSDVGYAVRSDCKISYDLKTWQEYTLTTAKDSTTVSIGGIYLRNKGDRVYIKAKYTARASDFFSHTSLVVIDQSNDKKFRARGNIASLNHGNDDVYKTSYLTMTSEEKKCYRELFKDCTSLIQTPDLPATTLADMCYYGMFNGCTGLTQSSKLPAMTLADNCYSDMFRGCTGLVNAPELPATVITYQCYAHMFNGCTSLNKAPDLPAAALTARCYYYMFYGCTKLNHVKCLATTNLSATQCVESWLSSVSSTGDFYTPAATNWTRGSSGIPSGWTRHDIT